MKPQHSAPAIVTEVVLQSMDGEPRVRDLDLAEKLGFDRPRDIRKLIERNMVELEKFGAPQRRANEVRSGRGRVTEVEEFHLNEEQALLVSVLSNAPNAAAVRAMLIRVFVAFRRGELQKPKAANDDFHHQGRESRLQFKQGLAIARMIGLSGNQAALSANLLTIQTTGVDVLGAMGQKHLVAPQQEALLTPSDIGKALGNRSAIAINELLQRFGFQVGRRDHKNRPYWEPTSKGVEAGAVMTDVARDNGTGNSRQLRWASRIITTLRNLIGGA